MSARHRAARRGRHGVLPTAVKTALLAVLAAVAIAPVTVSAAAYTDRAQSIVAVTAAGGVPFTQISAAGAHACAVDDTARVWCWGVTDLAGQQGETGRGNFTIPTLITTPARATSVTAGYEHSCALSDAQVWCWGTNAYGQRGTGSTAAAGMTQVDASGAYHTCTLDTAGTAWCWGMGTSGQLGAGTTSSPTPVRVAGAPGAFSRIDTGYMSTCALDAERVWCWGNNASGQSTGTSSTATTSRPTAVGPATVRDFSVGGWFACALDSAGAPWCWGSDQFGQRGDGTQVTDAVTAVDTAERFVSISAGDHHACALTADGAVWCWGYNASRQLGDGTATDRTTPVKVALPDTSPVKSVAAGAYFTCAITTAARTWCWGAADGVGNGAVSTPSLTPTQPTVPWR